MTIRILDRKPPSRTLQAPFAMRLLGLVLANMVRGKHKLAVWIPTDYPEREKPGFKARKRHCDRGLEDRGSVFGQESRVIRQLAWPQMATSNTQ